MSAFENNWTAYQARYPESAQRMNGVTLPENYKMTKAPGCLPNLTINNEDYYCGDMAKYFDSQWKGLNLDRARVALFLGFGLGYDVDYYMQRYSKLLGTHEIIVVEKNVETMCAAMNGVDITKIINHEHIHIFAGYTISELFIRFRDLFRESMEMLLMSPMTNALFVQSSYKKDAEYYKGAYNVYCEAAWNCLQTYGNDPWDSLIGVENMFDNIDVILENPGINMLYGKFDDCTAVIVAAGPSLAKSIDKLREIQHKVLIIACDASLKYLLENGIRPHIVASLEREHEVQQFFDELHDVDDIYMAVCPVLYRHVIDSYNGPKFIVYRNFDHFKWLNIDKGLLDIQLSSANMAYKIAEALGCRHILLVGQDLAFGEDGSSHAMNVPFSCEGEEQFDVPGNHGGKVRTTSFWHTINSAYQMDISKNKDTIMTINCTDGGAAIPGTYIKGLDEVAEIIPGYTGSVTDRLKCLLEHKDISEDKNALKSLISKTESELMLILDMCNSGIDAVIAYRNAAEKTTDLRDMAVSYRIKMQEYKDTWQLYLMHILQSYHIKSELEVVMETADEIEAISRMDKWYNEIGCLIYIALQAMVAAKGKLWEQQ